MYFFEFCNKKGEIILESLFRKKKITDEQFEALCTNINSLRYESMCSKTEQLFKELISAVLSDVEFLMLKILGKIDDDLKSEIIINLTTKWVYHKPKKNYRNMIFYYIDKHITSNKYLNGNFKTLNNNEKRTFIRLRRLKSTDVDYEYTKQEEKELQYLNSKMTNIVSFSDVAIESDYNDDFNPVDTFTPNDAINAYNGSQIASKHILDKFEDIKDFLTEDEYNLLYMYYVEELSQEVIGEELGTYKMDISRKIEKILNKLRIEFKDKE